MKEFKSKDYFKRLWNLGYAFTVMQYYKNTD